MSVQWPIILGSRSPRRLELLSKLVDPKRIEVLPPSDEAERGFEDVSTRTDFADRICEIVQAKEANVLEQLKARRDFRDCFLLTCDTTVIGTKADGRLVALGQPTETEWQQTVREWFLNYYAGRTHSVMSCMSLSRVTDSAVQRETSICETRVTMRDDIEPELDWYIASNESPGKAGGYAIQGLASTFVSRLEGSFTNVVGLPLENTLQLLRQARAI
jgi:septum formation protein